MAYYDTCDKCGGTLDPGERCTCESEQEKRSEFFERRMMANHRTGQYSLILDGRESQYAANIAN